MSVQHVYSSTASAASSVATTSSNANASPPANNHIMIIGIVLGIFGLLLVLVAIFVVLRMKRRTSVSSQNDIEPFAQSSFGRRLDQYQTAAQITPFGSPGGESPRFKHTPGSDMRIATRRPDGAWQFADPRDPFTPSGVSEIDVVPSPSSSTPSLLPPHVRRKRDTDSKSSYDPHFAVPLSPPPPAYGYGYSGYMPPRKN